MSSHIDLQFNAGTYIMSREALAVALGLNSAEEANRFFSKHGAMGDTFTAAEVHKLTVKRFAETGRTVNREGERATELGGAR